LRTETISCDWCLSDLDEETVKTSMIGVQDEGSIEHELCDSCYAFLEKAINEAAEEVKRGTVVYNNGTVDEAEVVKLVPRGKK
jgi:hypothetical protein